MRRVFEIVEHGRLGELDGQTARDIGIRAHMGEECLEPGAVACGHSRHIERKVDGRVTLERVDRELEHALVDKADEAHALRDLDEFRRGNQLTVRLNHAQEALILNHLAGLGVDDRLIGEREAPLVQRLDHLVGDRHHPSTEGFLMLGRLVKPERVAAAALGVFEGLLGAYHGFFGRRRALGHQHRARRHGGADGAERRLDD